MSKWCWSLVGDNNVLLTGWQKVGDYWYYMYSNGQMACDEWIQLNNLWYKINDKGQMLTGWYQDTSTNKWYYLEPNSTGNGKGSMYKSCTSTIDGKDYTFNDDGSMVETNTSLVSDDCLSFVKGYEKFYSYKYDDNTGTLTQGYGATGNEIANWGDTITEAEASDELQIVINANYATPIKADLDAKGVTLTQSQFDSFTSCAYNIGVSSLLGSSIYKYVVNGGRDADIIMTDFLMWDKCYNEDTKQIEVSQGLYNRRVAEANIFNNGVYDSTH